MSSEPIYKGKSKRVYVKTPDELVMEFKDEVTATIRESLLEKLFDIGDRFVETCGRLEPPGLSGLLPCNSWLPRTLTWWSST
jgi:5-formaminoimidazole-4-carboxamide-1-beta-D-ribofuranosyl 5'-monophosphate synthetase